MADQPDTQAPPNETDREREKRIIKSIIESSDRVGLQEGHTYCLIAAPWWSSWQRYVVYHAAYMTEGERPGPIDNAFLLDGNAELRVNEIQERVHFHYLPKEAWDILFEWYGGGPMIDRICIKTWNNYLTIELKKLKLSVIWSRDPKNILVRSFGKSTPISKFLEEMRKEMRWNRKNIRLIDFYQARRTSTIGPERWHKSLEECQIMDKQYVLIEEKKKNGQWPDDSIYKHLQNQQSYYTAPPSPPGQTGLNNLGNTCFMNSALQCLSATVPLTDYFLSGKFLPDVNTTNPLGMGGEIAREYRNFLSELWSSAVGSHAPRAMKSKIERFAPQFGGYQQHDSQELLAFLLDGLHEDLNRIQKKPPVEVLDTWGPEEAWEGHKKRNDSVIVDLFQGQLKSRLRCPNNQRLSNVYDPFMYLTVQLPVDNSRKIVLTVYRMDPKIKPLKICVTVDKDGSIKDVKKAITAITTIKPECLALVDVGASKFYREWKDDEDVGDIRETDTVAAHEIVPTPPKTTKVVKVDTDSEEDSKEGSEESETVRIVILHKRLGKSSGFGFGDTYFGTPLILCVPTDITYKELYCRCVDHLSGGAPEGATSGGIWKEIPSKLVTTDPPPVDAPPSDPGSFSDNTVFELEYTQTPGYYQKLPSCVNDDYPLRLPDRRWVQLVWQTPLYKRFIDESKTDFPEVDVHESCKGMVTERTKTRSTVSLTECLNLFNEEEQLSENDSWYCSDCKSHVQAYKQFTIWKAPKLLVIHLKRFSYRGRAFRERLDHLVEFPFKDLDMGPYIEGPKDYCTKYDLYAVSNHFGSLGGGHYTAYAKSRDDDTWFQFDDSNVSTVRDTSNICSSAAYVLFYKRQDVEWTAFDPAFDQARKVVQEAAKEEAPVNTDDEYDPPSSEEEVVQAAVVQDNTGQPADSGEGANETVVAAADPGSD